MTDNTYITKAIQESDNLKAVFSSDVQQTLYIV